MVTTSKRMRISIIRGGKPGKTYDRAGIKKIIEEYSGMRFEIDYQESHLAGVLATLVKKGVLVSKERGMYEFSVDADDKKDEEDTLFMGVDVKSKISSSVCEEEKTFAQIKKLVEESLKQEIDYLKGITVTISLSEIEKKDLDNVLQIKELISYLESFQLS